MDNVRLVLVNWKEVGLKGPPVIAPLIYNYGGDFYALRSIGPGRSWDTTYHKSINAAKRYFRIENSVKGKTPRFIWKPE